MKHPKKWLIVGAAIPFIVVTTVFILSQWSNGPATGTVHTGAPKASTTQPVTAPTPLVVQSSLFTTSLPGGFEFKDASPPTTELPVRLLATNSASRQQVGFTGGKLPSDGLQGVADYHLRTTDTTTYHRSTNTKLPAGSSAFEDATGSMVTLFWPHGGQYVAVTVSGNPGTKTAIYDTLYKILQAWEWS